MTRPVVCIVKEMQKNIYARLVEDFELVEFRFFGVLKLDPTGTWTGGREP